MVLYLYSYTAVGSTVLVLYLSRRWMMLCTKFHDQISFCIIAPWYPGSTSSTILVLSTSTAVQVPEAVAPAVRPYDHTRVPYPYCTGDWVLECSRTRSCASGRLIHPGAGCSSGFHWILKKFLVMVRIFALSRRQIKYRDKTSFSTWVALAFSMQKVGNIWVGFRKSYRRIHVSKKRV
jgi:hypothetical protein